MHSALFVVQISENRGTWLSFLAKSKAALRPFPNVSRLAENVWLVNVQESPTPLGYLVCAAERSWSFLWNFAISRRASMASGRF